MKKIVLFISISMIAVAVNAQVNEATFRLMGGLSLPKYKYSLDGVSSSRNVNQGFSGALMASFYTSDNSDIADLGLNIGGHLGFNYTQKGAVNKNLSGQGQIKADNRINYFQGDAMGSIGFGKKRSKGTFIDICAGPYLAYAMNGKQKIELSDGSSLDTDFKFGTASSDDFIKFDLGLKTGLLFTISSRYSIAAMYEYGLSDIAPQESLKIQNRNFLVTAGINFGYKKR